MAVPYAVSALLTKVPENLRLVSSYSDLIMQEDFAFGQVTPFIGTKPWASLKLWMMMRAHGRTGLARLVEHRLDITRRFVSTLDQRPRFLRLQDPDLTAVAFMYLPADIDLETYTNRSPGRYALPSRSTGLEHSSVACLCRG